MNVRTTAGSLQHACRLGVAASTAVLLMSTVLSGPAAADHIECGDEITEDTTLTHDLGPCPTFGSGPLAGLTVTASNITLDLGGHRIIGDPQARHTMEIGTGNLGSKDQPAIRLRNVTGVVVENGTVERFDAGVEIMGGSGNTVRAITARDNVNYRVVSGEDADPAVATPVCRLGEGISLFNSSDNLVEGNTILGNGPFAGITARGTWPSTTGPDRNVIRDNLLVDNDVANLTPDGRVTVCGTGDEQTPLRRGQAIQTVGISVEGPGANDNRIEGNDVRTSAIAGIGIHGYVCDQGGASTGTLVAGNIVSDTGLHTHEQEARADGIATLQQGDTATMCVSDSTTIRDNTSSGNLRDGVFLGGRGSHSNVVEDNTVDDNARNGITVSGPTDDLPGATGNTLHRNSGFGNGGFDGADLNPDCDDNDWADNTFGSVNQSCVGTAQPPPPETGAIAGTVTDAASSDPIEGATVSAGDRTAMTDADGSYMISGLEPGDYTVTASADGYMDASQTATVTEGETITVDFALEADEPEPEPEPEPGNPQTRSDCMRGGWRDYGFRNQGQCIRYVQTGKDSRP